MNIRSRATKFVATAAGRRLLETSREKPSVAGGRVVVATMCSMGKTRPDLFVQVLRVLLRQQSYGTDHLFF
jgi:hypothetical protein